MNKGKKSLKIFITGVVSQIVTLGMGIIIPKLLIVSYGSEINGLLTSIRQIFVYVALLEAGIGTASLQAMYEPIAKDDKQSACSIMAATDRYFKRTGLLYGLAVALLAVLYPVVVKTELSFFVVSAIILLQGSAGVIKYYFQGKLTILLRVDGKSYVTTNIATIVSVATHAVQIGLILVGFDIIAVQVSYFIINLAQMLYLTWYVKRNYPWLDLTVTPNFKALAQSKNVIIHQISGLVFNNTDVLVLTYFCGLKTVSVYSLYSLIFSCVANVIDTLCSSVEFILGQAFNSDRKKFLQMQEVYETYYLGISFSFFTIALIMFPSFIRLYAGEITDINYVDPYLPFLFVGLNVLMYARRTSSQIINFAGHFKQTQWRSVVESVINLSVSLILVYKIGIYGVLIGTIAALLYRTNDVILYANINILGRKPWRTYRRWGQNLAVMVLCVLIINRLLPEIGSYVQWFGVAVVVGITTVAMYIVVDSICDVKCCQGVIKIIRPMIKKHK